MEKKMNNVSQDFRFRQFSNASFALFRTLHRPVSVGVLSVAVLMGASLQEVQAQEQKKEGNMKLLELEEVEVTGSRIPTAVSQSARMVTVLTREQIADVPAQSVNDLLKFAVGVDVRQRGQMGMQTDISIRGGSFNQISILLNGVNINDPQSGHNSVDIPVDISQIERIEVLEGPAGRVYGTSSLIGAINIVTRTHTQHEGALHAEAGSYGYANVGGSLALVGKRTWHAFSANYARTDGYSRNKAGALNSDFNAVKGFYEGRYQKENVAVSWHGGVSAKGFGANTFYSWASDDQYERTLKLFTALKAEAQVGDFHLQSHVYWNRNQDRYEFYRGVETAVPFNYHRTDVFGVHVGGYFQTVLGKTSVGAEMRNEDLISTNMGDSLRTPKPIHGTERLYYRGLKRTNMSAHIEHNVRWGGFSLSAGVMMTKNTYYEDGFRFYPGVDMSYQIGQAWKVYASYNTSTRLPDITELYYRTRDMQADKYLREEKMQAIEGGVKYITPAVRATLSVYHNRGKNIIDWVQPVGSTTSIWKSINHRGIQITGVEATVAFDMKELFPRQGFWRTWSISYNYISQHRKNVEGLTSRYALQYLRHKLVTQANFRLYDLLNLHIAYRWHDRMGTYNRGNEVLPFHSYGVLDARLSWDAPRYKLFLETNNVLNKTYYDYGDVPQPGAWFQVGGAWKFTL